MVLCQYCQYSDHILNVLLHHIAQEYAHIEDILCVAFGAPNLMATASFDGQVRNSSDMKEVSIAELFWWWKKALRFSQDLNMGFLNAKKYLGTNWVASALTMQSKAYTKEIQPENWAVSMDIYHLSSAPIPAPVAQLVRASDQSSEDPGSNPGWISMSLFTTSSDGGKL